MKFYKSGFFLIKAHFTSVFLFNTDITVIELRQGSCQLFTAVYRLIQAYIYNTPI